MIRFCSGTARKPQDKEQTQTSAMKTTFADIDKDSGASSYSSYTGADKSNKAYSLLDCVTCAIYCTDDMIRFCSGTARKPQDKEQTQTSAMKTTFAGIDKDSGVSSYSSYTGADKSNKAYSLLDCVTCFIYCTDDMIRFCSDSAGRTQDKKQTQTSAMKTTFADNDKDAGVSSYS